MSGCVKIILDLFQENLNKAIKPYIFKFKTNVQKFRIHYQSKNVSTGNYPHMGVTVREGIHVLYRIEGNVQWLNVDAYTARNSPIDVNMKYLASENQTYEILIYGPVLSEIQFLKVETEDNSSLTILDSDFSKDVLIIGGIHTLGIGCTASGVMFSNILSRKFNKHFQNISFNDNNHLKAIYENIDCYNLDKYDTIILELDYIKQDLEIFDKYSDKIIKKLRSKCDNLICWYTFPKSSQERVVKLNDFSKKYSRKKDVTFLDLSFIYDDMLSEMCTHSHNYINDAGNIMIYKKLLEKLNEKPEETKLNEKLRGLRNGIFKFNR